MNLEDINKKELSEIDICDNFINSMTTFKQIIGRGTRIHEELNKYYFTIMDFKKATSIHLMKSELRLKLLMMCLAVRKSMKVLYKN